MFCQVGDIVIHATIDGPAQAPPVLLLHSLGTTLQMWDPQAAALAKHYRVIRMDMRGHGLSEAPAGPYTMAMLAQDALGLLDSLGIAEAHVGGVSIGGRIALQIAAMAPGRVISLMPCDTALEIRRRGQLAGAHGPGRPGGIARSPRRPWAAGCWTIRWPPRRG